MISTLLRISNRKNLVSSLWLLMLLFSVHSFGQQPTITSFSPSVVTARTTVTIHGTNFTASTGVSFGGTAAASKVLISPTEIRAVVGGGASGNVVVSNGSLTAALGTVTYVAVISNPSGSVANRVTTDWNNYWTATGVTTGTNQPDNHHNMLAFGYGSSVYSTGVNDAILTTPPSPYTAVPYVAADFRALPLLSIEGTVGDANYLIMGNKIDGNAASTNFQAPGVAGLKVKDVLIDGIKGLDIGTGVTNLPVSAVFQFPVGSVNSTSVGDAIPDLVITQVADPSGVSDYFMFTDVNGNIVGSPIQAVFTGSSAVGTYRMDLFSLQATSFATAVPDGNANAGAGTRDIRIIALKLSDFGINGTNYANIKGFKALPGGNGDPAFIAYNAGSVIVDSPVITTHPVSQTVCNGTSSSATFTVVATGTDLTYQWKKNGIDIVGATTNSYTVTNVVASSAAAYSVVVSNATGSVVSNTVYLNSFFVAQPTAASTICRNSSLTLSSSASGNVVAYQWYSNTTASNTGGTLVSGQTAATYSVPSSVAGTFYYYVVITSNGQACTAIPSTVATVVVDPTSVGGTASGATTICSGSTANLSLTGQTGSIQWEYALAAAGPWTNAGGTGNTSASYTTPALTATRWYRAKVTSGQCTTATSTTVVVTVNPASNAGTVTSPTICYNTSTTVSTTGYVGTLQWQVSADGTTNWTNIVGATGPTYTTPLLTTNSYFRVIATNSPCGPSAPSAVITVSVSTNNTWNGSTSSDWDTAANWSCNIVPNADLDALIPDVGVNPYPVVSSNLATARNLNVATGANVTLNATGTLKIAGAINVTGTGIVNSLLGTIDFIGTSAQTLPAAAFTSHTIKSVATHNATTVTLVGDLNLTGVLGLKAGTFNTGNSLTLKSDASRTAIVSEVLGSISGTMTVERYIPLLRAFRFLTSPTTGGTAKTNWQEGGADVVGLGTDITGPGGAANGFDVSNSNNPSMFTYLNNNPDNSSTANNWYTIPNTNEPTIAGVPYRILIRGDRTINQAVNLAPATITTLRTTGTILTGEHTLTDLNPDSSGFSLIGNPYQCPVDMQEILYDLDQSDDLVSFYTIWNPQINERGGYVTINLEDNTNNLGDAIYGDNYLQPGQAAFVQTVPGGGTPSITFKESNKHVSTTTTPVFRTTNNIQEVAKLRMTLYDNEALAAGGNASDGFVVYFSNEFTNEIDESDAKKPSNQDEGVGTVVGEDVLSFQSHTIPTADDVLQLSHKSYRKSQYTYKATINGLSGVTAYLYDTYADSYSEIVNDATTNISFDVDATIAASAAVDRFQVVFQTEALGGHDNALSHSVSLYPNPVTEGQFYVKVPSADNYEVTLMSVLGQVISSNTMTSGQNTLLVKPAKQLASGVYMVQVTDGKLTTTKKIIVK